MKRITLLIIVLLSFLNLSGFSQNSLLWEITGNGIKKPSYLYGTFHVRDKRVFQFDKIVYKKLKKCDVVTGELDMDMGKMMMSLFTNINQLFLPRGTKLKDLYEDSTDYNLVNSCLTEKLGFMASLADSMQPILTAMMMSEGEGEFSSDYQYVLDDHFQRVGKMKGKEVKGLETMEEQLDALSGIDINEQAEMLLQTCTDTSSDNVFGANNMIAIYCNQDINAMDSLINKASGDDFSEKLLYRRNKNMANRIHDIIQKKPAFNTFGAAHLSGEYGVINLLRKKGYQVEPVYFRFDIKNKPIDTE